MAAATIARLTVALCLLAAAIEVVLGCTSTAGLTPGDALIMLFVIGPYLLLALFAWRQRGQPRASWMVAGSCCRGVGLGALRLRRGQLPLPHRTAIPNGSAHGRVLRPALAVGGSPGGRSRVVGEAEFATQSVGEQRRTKRCT